MKRFQDEVVVVTGGSAGIGAEVARKFHAEGARVVIVARRQGPLDVLKDELGGDTLAISADMGDLEQCFGVIDQTVERFGQLDVLVNNAGRHDRGPFDQHDAHAFASMVDINLRAPP